MATNRKRLSRALKPKTTNWQIDFLLTGQEPEKMTLDFLELHGNSDLQRRIWNEIKGDELLKWIKKNPGTRPFAFWKFDSTEPRQRISGTEKTFADITPAVKETYSFGLPAKPYTGAITFESEPAYLRRHNLLSAAEIKKLETIPGAFNPVVIDNNKGISVEPCPGGRTLHKSKPFPCSAM